MLVLAYNMSRSEYIRKSLVRLERIYPEKDYNFYMIRLTTTFENNKFTFCDTPNNIARIAKKVGKLLEKYDEPLSQVEEYKLQEYNN